MGERDRVLIACKLVWDSLVEFEDLFAKHDVAFDVPSIPGQQLSEEELLPIIDRYDGILAGDDHLSRSVLLKGRRLRVISKWGIGIDAIDTDAAAELGISVYNTPGVFGDELGDYALGYLLLLARGQHIVDRQVRQGSWHKVRGQSLAGKTIGIVGLGSSGQALARRTAVMGMHVLGYDVQPPGESFLRETGCEMVELDQLLAASDVVSLHAPATEQTRRLMNAGNLAAMKRGSWLINISRGSLVDEPALVQALKEGHIAAAALDVFESEPFASDNPLAGFPNVILGSHNGSNTFQAVERTNERAIANLLIGLGRDLDA